MWVTCGALIFAVHSSRFETLLGSLGLQRTFPFGRIEMKEVRGGCIKVGLGLGLGKRVRLA